MVATEDYYHMTIMDENNTSIVNIFFKPKAPFCTSTFISKF
jgi:hypothetical protein